MSFKIEDVGRECPFCHEAKLIQYRSGKVGCGAYCWKNKADDTGSYPPPKSGFNKAVNTGNEIILETIQEGFNGINNRLDLMGKYFANKEKEEKEGTIQIDDGEF